MIPSISGSLVGSSRSGFGARAVSCSPLSRRSRSPTENQPLPARSSAVPPRAVHRMGWRGKARARKPKTKTPVPARYLIACVNGHLDEFPYAAWVHRGKPCERGRAPDCGCGNGRATSVRTCRSCVRPATPPRHARGNRPEGRESSRTAGDVTRISMRSTPATSPAADDARRRQPVVFLDLGLARSASRGSRLSCRSRADAAGAARPSWTGRGEGRSAGCSWPCAPAKTDAFDDVDDEVLWEAVSTPRGRATPLDIDAKHRTDPRTILAPEWSVLTDERKYTRHSGSADFRAVRRDVPATSAVAARRRGGEAQEGQCLHRIHPDRRARPNR